MLSSVRGMLFSDELYCARPKISCLKFVFKCFMFVYFVGVFHAKLSVLDRQQ